MEPEDESIGWVVLTMGDRPDALRQCLESLVSAGARSIVLVANGCDVEPPELPEDVTVVRSAENRGVPGGRTLGAASLSNPLIGFLDDDAVLETSTEEIAEAFRSDHRLAVVALRIVDESGSTARRHTPRFGSNAERSGPVATFLGGACVIRARALTEVGGFWNQLWYGHEELDLAWRLVDRAWSIRYLASARVRHPRTEISRHGHGWRLTGRNRVMIARRSLPWPVLLLHTAAWLVVGALRAPDGRCTRGYLSGWRSGWTQDVDRSPIAWKTVWRLTRLGRPPVL